MKNVMFKTLNPLHELFSFKKKRKIQIKYETLCLTDRTTAPLVNSIIKILTWVIELFTRPNHTKPPSIDSFLM